MWTIDEIEPKKILDKTWWVAFSHTYKHFRWVVPWVWTIQVPSPSMSRPPVYGTQAYTLSPAAHRAPPSASCCTVLPPSTTHPAHHPPVLLQNKAHTLFAGSWTLFNTHDIAIASGLAAAERLGAPYPFERNPMAMATFVTVMQTSHLVFRRPRHSNRAKEA